MFSLTPSRSVWHQCDGTAFAQENWEIIIYSNKNVLNNIFWTTVHWYWLLSKCFFGKLWISSSRPSDAIWQHWSRLILLQVMAGGLMPPSHYLNYWFIICGVLWYSAESNFEVSSPVTLLYNEGKFYWNFPTEMCDGLQSGFIEWFCVVLEISRWRHQMETFFRVTGLYAGNSPVTGDFASQRPVTRSFDVFFDLRLNKRLSKQSWG